MRRALPPARILWVAFGVGACSGRAAADVPQSAAASRERPASVESAAPRSEVAPARAATPHEPVASAESPPPSEPVVAPAPREPLSLAFVGDVIFGRYREAGYDPIPEDGFAVFEEVAPLLEADVLIGNLETPLLRELPVESPIGAQFRFGASLEHARALAEAGFTAMSLANNHWYDLREEGVAQTPVLLRELGVIPLGAAVEPPFRVETIEAEGWRVGLAAVTNRSNAPLREGMPPAPYLETRRLGEVLAPLLAEARPDHDALVVFVHWGDEYLDQPNPTQQRAAAELVRAGADLVVGHHPHVLQGIQAEGNGVVAYSLGNFLFENTRSPPRFTGVLHVELTEPHCLRHVRFAPAYIKRYPVQHPVPATGGMGKVVRGRMLATSTPFGTTFDRRGEDLVLAVDPCDAAPPTPRE